MTVGGPIGKEPSHVQLSLKAAELDASTKALLMSSTNTILTIPAPGTSIKPVYEYTQQQKDQMVALRQASSSTSIPF